MSWIEKTIQRSVDEEFEKLTRNIQTEWQNVANEIIKYFSCIMILR